MAKCKACGAPIIWIKTPGGKSMPCDPEQRTYWHRKGAKEKIVTPNGALITCALDGDTINDAVGVGYVPHWATCPGSRQATGSDIRDAAQDVMMPAT